MAPDRIHRIGTHFWTPSQHLPAIDAHAFSGAVEWYSAMCHVMCLPDGARSCLVGVAGGRGAAGRHGGGGVH